MVKQQLIALHWFSMLHVNILEDYFQDDSVE